MELVHRALTHSTTHAAEFLNHSRGKVAEGYYADFVVLAKDPILDIKNTRSISLVIMNGEVIERDKLQLGNN